MASFVLPNFDPNIVVQLDNSADAAIVNSDNKEFKMLALHAIDFGSAFSALSVLTRDPGRLDQVLVLGEAVNRAAAEQVWGRLTGTPEGESLARDRPRLNRDTVDFEVLAALPDGTLGREYVRFLSDNKITPDAFHSDPAFEDDQAVFMSARMRQTHDLWHVITGFSPDVHGEIVLQAFTYGQTGAPSAWLIGVLGVLRYGKLRPAFVRECLRAYRLGKAAPFFGAMYWEKRWERPVRELRAELGLPVVGIA